MSVFKSFPDIPHLTDVIKAFPYTWKPLLEYHDRLLRHEQSAFTVAERELIAAYTSGLNQCQFCYGAHKILADTFGYSEPFIESLFEDFEQSGCDEKVKAILRFTQKLNNTPSKMTDKDRQTVLDAGWPEQALHDASAICGLFNMMNRIVEGMGVMSNDAVRAEQRKRNSVAKDEPINPNSYQDFGKNMCGIE